MRVTLPHERVELAYLDLNEPLVATVLDELAAVGDPVRVVPLLLGDGYHSRFDLPVLLDAARRRWPTVPMTQTPVLGSAALVGALCDRARQAGLTSTDGVVLYAVGSSDERSDNAARRRGCDVAAALGVPVQVVFATKLGPDGQVLRDAVAALHHQRIVGLPYFLSSGLLTERVESLLVDLAPGSLIAAPLADHRAVVAAIAALAAPADQPWMRERPSPHSASRNSFLRILPVEVLGRSSMKSTSRGAL